ncbi:serine hydroxymethyltransferase [bacterium endosymbiont of Pedicinus badii]|uniref:serine hydroxymethyltransferase n=1 Tax=bacterium endosymbiont of Pedicinus badii TaxID=1719126 RepID=UPI0009BA383C|nr:serine hydroxymethyltransferase [bacterium endosymbiont of Pedicinus badii]OQM34490.1 serine hydroxymethyltransferase [bacterium endosymbiont of Pedicinus badii]
MKKKIFDKEIWNIIHKESLRQENYINLIASESYATYEVMKAQGSKLTNKYAEGYSKNRYYSGCKYIDEIEEKAISRAKKLFSVRYANVQPHSGSQANFSVYLSVLRPGDKVLGMQLSHGGHLTHGNKCNFSGKLYKFSYYGVENNGYIDYTKIYDIARTKKPKMIVAGFSSYSRIIDWKKMREIADINDSYLLADISHVAGLVATKLYPSPVDYADFITLTTHKTLSGPRGALILSNLKDKKILKKIDSSVFPGTQGGPFMHVIAAKAIALKDAMSKKFLNYQKRILKNSKEMSKVFLSKKFTIVSNGTDSHLFVLDLRNKNISGKKASQILESSHILVNKNSIPNDLKNAKVTSGIRIGTTAISRRKIETKQAKKIAYLICKILTKKSTNTIKKSKQEILKICKKYPVYKNLF